MKKPTDAEPSTDNPRIFGKYDVLQRLAVGGMGEIFLARQVGVAGFDRFAILKSLLPQLALDENLLGQFLDEARIVGAINHPNVVGCFEVGEWQGVYFIAMEYVNGVDLYTLQSACAAQGGRVPPSVALALMREAALGLDSAHHAKDPSGQLLKIVHRDVSPQNIMVRADGLVKVVDFGVSTAANRQRRTDGGQLKGKLGYIAPEQIKGKPAHAKGDQFSLGVVLWELLCGRQLFVGESPEAVFMRIVREPIPPPSSIVKDLPPEIDALVMRMTAKDEGQRFGRLADAAYVMRKLLDAIGAPDDEPARFVDAMVGAQLARRQGEVKAQPTRILGISEAVALAANAPPPPPRAVEPEVQDLDVELDVPLDDNSEAAVVAGVIEFLDVGGAHPPPDAMVRTLLVPLSELCERYSGQMSVSGHRFFAAFTGAGRAARVALAFARRSIVLALRAHHDLRVRVGITATDGPAEKNANLAADAERVVLKARPGQTLLTDDVKRLAHVAHRYSKGPTIKEGGPPLSTSELAPPPRVVGRGAERLLVEQAVAAADVSRGQQLLFLGEPGSGKSALLGLVDAEARDRGFLVARVACGRMRATLTLDAIRQAIRGCLSEYAMLEGADNSGVDDADWTQTLRVLALDAHDHKRISALLNDTPFVDDVTAAQQRVRLKRAVVAFFSALADKRGVCIVLDDAHLADRTSLDLFAAVSVRLMKARYLIVGALRPMPGERVLPLAKRAHLEPLEVKDLMQVVARTLGGVPPDGAAERIAAAAQGSPLMAALFTRYFVAIGLLRVAGDVVTQSVDIERFPMQPNLSVLLFSWHALLSPEGRLALEATASLGQSAPLFELAQLVQNNAGFAEAEQAGVLAKELVDGQPSTAFLSLSEMTTVVERMRGARAAAFDARVATVLMPTDLPKASLERCERAAFALARSGAFFEHARLCARAAELAGSLGAIDAASLHYREAMQATLNGLRQGPPDAARVSDAFVLCQRASRLLSELDPASAADVLLPLLRVVPSNLARPERLEAMRVRASILLAAGQADTAKLVLQEAFDERLDGIAPALKGALSVELAQAELTLGDVAAARTAIDAARANVTRATSSHAAFVCCQARLALKTATPDDARHLLDTLLNVALLPQQYDEVIELRADVEFAASRLDQAVALLRQAAVRAQRAGAIVTEFRMLLHGVTLLERAGRIAEAEAMAAQALECANQGFYDEGRAMLNERTEASRRARDAA